MDMGFTPKFPKFPKFRASDLMDVGFKWDF
jgi:hypothetical protein